jgi:CBS domain-containing protein
MSAATILKAKGNSVVTMKPGDSLEDAAQLMTKRGVGCVVVAERGALPTGILSERDIVREIAIGGSARLKATVSEAMTRPVHTCALDDTIDHLMAVMTARRFRHLPVVADGQLAGIVSIGDVVKFKIAEAEMETEAMRTYITTG